MTKTVTLNDLAFGDLAQDRITGFSGIVIAYAEYATGCNQVLLQPMCEEGEHRKMPDSHWLDVERIELVHADHTDIASSPTGGPRGADAPPKR